MASQGQSTLLTPMSEASPQSSCVAPPRRVHEDTFPRVHDFSSLAASPGMEWGDQMEPPFDHPVQLGHALAPVSRPVQGWGPNASLVFFDIRMGVRTELQAEAYIVGREPAASRSALVDAGASVTIYGDGWLSF